MGCMMLSFENNNQSITKKSQLKILSFFTDHPKSVGETYIQHFFVAFRFSLKLFMTSIAALIHAFLPALFKKTASRQIKNMYREMTSRK